MTEIGVAVVSALWFFIPCGIANSVPVFVMHIPGLKKLNYPLDCYKSFRGVRIFGDHKSWRGLISGMIFGLIVVAIQTSLYNSYDWAKQISWVKYDQVNTIVFGLLAGAGPLLGDAIKSFFKRRQNLKPGATWFPFDQIDYIVGGIVFLLPVAQLLWWQYLTVFVLFFALHLISTSVGYLLRLKDSPI